MVSSFFIELASLVSAGQISSDETTLEISMYLGENYEEISCKLRGHENSVSFILIECMIKSSYTKRKFRKFFANVHHKGFSDDRIEMLSGVEPGSAASDWRICAM